jgi:hypothetical protein
VPFTPCAKDRNLLVLDTRRLGESVGGQICKMLAQYPGARFQLWLRDNKDQVGAAFNRR